MTQIIKIHVSYSVQKSSRILAIKLHVVYFPVASNVERDKKKKDRLKSLKLRRRWTKQISGMGCLTNEYV